MGAPVSIKFIADLLKTYMLWAFMNQYTMYFMTTLHTKVDKVV